MITIQDLLLTDSKNTHQFYENMITNHANPALNVSRWIPKMTVPQLSGFIQFCFERIVIDDIEKVISETMLIREAIEELKTR